MKGIGQRWRLSDGKRRVMGIAESTGREGDRMQMQEIYKFVRNATLLADDRAQDLLRAHDYHVALSYYYGGTESGVRCCKEANASAGSAQVSANR